MIKLWNQTMPHRCVEDAFEPYLTPYDCDAAKTAIVVCPGGAYCGRADYEGNDVGAWLNTIGITAFVLEYRVAPSKAPAQPSDAQRAMRLARKLCMERGIERLGIMGFSAGGHLAATLSVHYDEAFYPPILAGFATTSCALLLNTNCRFPSLLVNFTLILHPLENWINRTNPVVSYYAKRTCISACAP